MVVDLVHARGGGYPGSNCSLRRHTINGDDPDSDDHRRRVRELRPDSVQGVGKVFLVSVVSTTNVTPFGGRRVCAMEGCSQDVVCRGTPTPGAGSGWLVSFVKS